METAKKIAKAAVGEPQQEVKLPTTHTKAGVPRASGALYPVWDVILGSVCGGMAFLKNLIHTHPCHGHGKMLRGVEQNKRQHGIPSRGRLYCTASCLSLYYCLPSRPTLKSTASARTADCCCFFGYSINDVIRETATLPR